MSAAQSVEHFHDTPTPPTISTCSSNCACTPMEQAHTNDPEHLTHRPRIHVLQRTQRAHHVPPPSSLIILTSHHLPPSSSIRLLARLFPFPTQFTITRPPRPPVLHSPPVHSSVTRPLRSPALV
ncbi:hypothetical protein OG21DRAFT_1490399 [Imleria badia]|nr:hypothetical protein OG21DRAFT_1490399 [Imleria badia]